VSTKEQKEMEYDEWKEKFGHEWEKETTKKDEKTLKEDPILIKKRHNEWLLNFFRGRAF